MGARGLQWPCVVCVLLVLSGPRQRMNLPVTARDASLIWRGRLMSQPGGMCCSSHH